MEFKEVVKQIDKAEKNVDKVLKAARLSRNETPRLSEETIFAMFVLILCFGFMAMLFICG